MSNNVFYQETPRLILRSPTMCTLANKFALNGTPIANGTGYIYVPDRHLAREYVEDATWGANYENQFRLIEEYPDISA